MPLQRIYSSNYLRELEPYFRIELNGTPLPPDVHKTVARLKLKEAEGEKANLRFTVFVPNQRLDEYIITFEHKIMVYAGYRSDYEPRGPFKASKITPTVEDGGVTFKIIAEEARWLADSSARRVVEQGTVLDLIRRVSADNNLAVETEGRLPGADVELGDDLSYVQTGETDGEFIARVAAEYGWQLTMTNGKVHVTPPTVRKSLGIVWLKYNSADAHILTIKLSARKASVVSPYSLRNGALNVQAAAEALRRIQTMQGNHQRAVDQRRRILERHAQPFYSADAAPDVETSSDGTVNYREKQREVVEKYREENGLGPIPEDSSLDEEIANIFGEAEEQSSDQQPSIDNIAGGDLTDTDDFDFDFGGDLGGGGESIEGGGQIEEFLGSDSSGSGDSGGGVLSSISSLFGAALGSPSGDEDPSDGGSGADEQPPVPQPEDPYEFVTIDDYAGVNRGFHFGKASAEVVERRQRESGEGTNSGGGQTTGVDLGRCSESAQDENREATDARIGGQRERISAHRKGVTVDAKFGWMGFRPQQRIGVIGVGELIDGNQYRITEVTHTFDEAFETTIKITYGLPVTHSSDGNDEPPEDADVCGQGGGGDQYEDTNGGAQSGGMSMAPVPESDGDQKGAVVIGEYTEVTRGTAVLDDNGEIVGIGSGSFD